MYKIEIYVKISKNKGVKKIDYQIAVTQSGTKRYPPHKHTFWEILCYTQGEGYLYTPQKNIPFKEGTIIIVPPETVHGSFSNKTFKNISIGGEFSNGFFSLSPIRVEDNADCDGKILAQMIYKNRMENKTYLNSLTNAYVNFLLSTLLLEKQINSVVNQIINTISENCAVADFNVAQLLSKYNYSPDYIRQQFKITTGMHPIEFLTKCRIEKACHLIEIYGKILPLSKIAENCGYTDYVYFSKLFKKSTQLSPMEYLKKHIH